MQKIFKQLSTLACAMCRYIITPSDERVYFNSTTIAKGHHRVTYRGVQTTKCPFDYILYQMIVFELRPDLIIEIGTHHGGNALYLADLMDILGHGTVHSIDRAQVAEKPVREHSRIKLYTRGWENYEYDEAKQFSRIIVIEDSSHTYENTLAVLQKFAQLVPVGLYIIVEDGIVTELGRAREFNGGPLRAINQFLKKDSGFVVDRWYSDFFGKNATFNPKGYLKRISIT